MDKKSNKPAKRPLTEGYQPEGATIDNPKIPKGGTGAVRPSYEPKPSESSKENKKED